MHTLDFGKEGGRRCTMVILQTGAREWSAWGQWEGDPPQWSLRTTGKRDYIMQLARDARDASARSKEQ